MRINRLKIKNFVSYDETELSLDGIKLAVFVGDLGAGKTTLIDSLQTLFLGTARGYNRSQAKYLSFRDGKSWSVEADCKHGDIATTVARTATTLRGGPTTDGLVALTQAEVQQFLAVDQRVLKAALDLWNAQNMTPPERRALALEILSVRPTEKELYDAGLSEPTIRKHALAGEWTKAAKAAADLRLGKQKMAEAITGKQPAAPEVEIRGKKVSALEIDDPKYQAMLAGLAAARQKYDDLLLKVGALQQKAQKDGLKARLAEVLPLLSRKEEEAEALDAMEAREKERQSNINLLLGEETRLKAEIKKIETWLGHAEKAGQAHKCSICGFEHAQEADPAKVSQAKTMLGEKRECLARAGEDVMKLRGESETLAIEVARGNVEKLAALDRERDTLEKEIAEPDEKEVLAEAEKNLVLLKEQISRGEKIIEVVREYRKALIDWKKAEMAANGHLKDVEILRQQEALCKPDGLPLKYFKDVRTIIEQRLDWWHAKGLLPWKLRVDEEFEVWAPHGPAFTASGSERWRIGLAIAASLTELSGLKFLAVDEGDTLTKKRKPALLRALYEMVTAGTIDQVFLTVAEDDRPKQAPAGSGIKLYWVTKASPEEPSKIEEA